MTWSLASSSNDIAFVCPDAIRIISEKFTLYRVQVTSKKMNEVYLVFVAFFPLVVVVPVNDIRPIHPVSIYSRPMDISVQNTFVHCRINRLRLFTIHQRHTVSFSTMKLIAVFVFVLALFSLAAAFKWTSDDDREVYSFSKMVLTV